MRQKCSIASAGRANLSGWRTKAEDWFPGSESNLRLVRNGTLAGRLEFDFSSQLQSFLLAVAGVREKHEPRGTELMAVSDEGDALLRVVCGRGAGATRAVASQL
jgi:hypothetical protein